MFCIGILDNMVGLMFTFWAGLFSIRGASYCSDNFEMIVIGHIAHGGSSFSV